MPTRLEFVDEPYRIEIETFVLYRQRNRIALDHTAFYPGIGVSPAAHGVIILSGKRR